ncbi:MAG TPA: hypothetical protein VG897_14965 [Terriglobales bacterium]|nr:hypothetical protein [Terriglobales bacterium]
MKYSKTLLFALFLACLPALAFGASNKYGSEKKDITVSSAIQVGSQQLTPGDYTLRWNNSGDATEVTFLQNGKEKIKAPAKFVAGSNSSNIALETSTAGTTRALSRVYVKNGFLDFASATASKTGSSSGTGESSVASQ